MPFRQTLVSGFPAVSLRSAQIELIVIPSLGAKVSNLRRLRRGREWLWRNQQIPLAIPAAGTSYVDRADSGGWDECVPTVGACELSGLPKSSVTLPDHGELWSLPWTSQVFEHEAGTVLVATVHGRIFPYEFQRRITLDPMEPTARFRYRIRNLGHTDFPFLWSPHPLLNVQPGTRLEVAGVTQVRADAVHGRADINPGQVLPWPLDGQTGGYTLPGPRGWAVKLFAVNGSDGAIVLTDPREGECLEFRFSPREIPQIGLWINLEGWAPAHRRPYYNLAIEPCLGAPDRLDQAIRDWRLASILQAGEERTWELTVTLRGS